MPKQLTGANGVIPNQVHKKEMKRILKPKCVIYIADIYYPLIIRAILNPFVPLSKAGDVKFYSLKEISI